MKLSFVTPRFGKDIVGGAEFAIGQLAKNCVEFSIYPTSLPLSG